MRGSRCEEDAMKRLAIFLAFAAAAGCQRDAEPTTTTTTTTSGTELTSARMPESVTPEGEASDDPADVELSGALRAAILADDTLSDGAKDVAIATSGERVVLRGTVSSQRERETLTRKARELGGARKVDDRL